jgi:tRNA threonylcarbamoyladenosine biosynthesis protein TsaE
MQFKVSSIQELEQVAFFLIEYLEKYKTFCFLGNLGAGKTTLISLICKQLEIKDTISSPTYAIIQEYAYQQQKICHIDLYRLKSIQEALDIGIEDCLYDNICFIEWANNFLDIIPIPYVKIDIQYQDDDRIIEINIIK